MGSVRGNPAAGRWLVWGLTAAVFLVLPHVFRSGFAITLMSQMGILIVFALAYNMMFGQGGMLSFGHAVYAGLGAFFAIHTMNWAAAGTAWMPVSLIPLAGGVCGAFFGIVFGYVTTRKAGTPFAMITLGIGEMVFAASLMFPDFFGGEGGISTNRVMGQPVLGVSYGPAIEVYYLIAAWCFACMVAMYAFSHTPLGRISNAVRDNPERAEFIGYDARRVRYIVLIASAFFAGISGALAAINFEIVTAENLSTTRSGAVLLAAFIGGAMVFFGPIIGSVVFILFAVALSEYTRAWQFYLGVFFVVMVMYAPGGIASLVMMNLRVIRYRLFGRLRGAYAGVMLTGVLLLTGVILVVEMSYHLALLDLHSDTAVRLFGVAVDAAHPGAWGLAFVTLAAGALSFGAMRRRFAHEWSRVQAEIEGAHRP
jgi:branched-chain amino acid transport system permease protein